MLTALPHDLILRNFISSDGNTRMLSVVKMPLRCAAAKGGISVEVYGLELPRKLLLFWQRTIWSPALSSSLHSSLDAGSGAVTFPV